MRSSEEKLHIARRHLPHWSLVGATYFVTMRLRVRPLVESEIRLLLEHIIAGHHRYYDLVAAVILPDHTHLLMSPRDGYSLSRIMKGLKGATARRLNQARGTKGTVWQAESFDRIVRDQQELDEKLNYMFMNPVKAGLTDDPNRYPGWYFRGQTGMSVLPTIDED
jgi:REP element-mobilizing transposase RayT